MYQDEIADIINNSLNRYLEEDDLTKYLTPIKLDYSSNVVVIPDEGVIDLPMIAPIADDKLTVNEPISGSFLVRGYISWGFAKSLIGVSPQIILLKVAPILQQLLNDAASRSSEVSDGTAKVQFKFGGKILQSSVNYAGYEIRLFVKKEN
jgi:hypothetical protein